MTPIDHSILCTFDALVRPERHPAEKFEEARLVAMGWSSSSIWLRAVELYNFARESRERVVEKAEE